MCCFGPCAFALSCAGIYFTPVSEALGVGRAAFALYLTIMLVVAALILPVLGKLFETKDLRVMLSGGVLSIGVPLICMSFFNQVWQFYIAGGIMGVGLAMMLVLTVPTLVNRWFRLHHPSWRFHLRSVLCQRHRSSPVDDPHHLRLARVLQHLFSRRNGWFSRWRVRRNLLGIPR